MEPALPPMHPKVPALLASLGLRAVDAFQWNVLLCADIGSPEARSNVVIKVAGDERKAVSIEYEIRIVREVLPALDQDDFEKLTLPEYVSDGTFEGLRWFTSRYIPGQALRFEWSELSSKPDILGGRPISADSAIVAVDTLRDLRGVDVETLPDFVRRFSFADWLEVFKVRSKQMVEHGLFRRETVDTALELFHTLSVERYEGTMFTNGDFYPRNFILLPNGKMAVADWVGGVDPWEFVAMNAWLMMWGNPEWQAAYIKELKMHFPVDIEEMQAGLLVGAADRVWQWRQRPEQDVGFSRTQLLQYFEKCLDRNFVQSIFD